jgi:chorismate mutase
MEPQTAVEKIEALRQLINRIDRQLITLIDDRMHLAYQIGQLKALLGKAVFDKEREAEVYENVRAMPKTMLSPEQAETLLSKIIELGRAFGEKGIANQNLIKENQKQ